MKKALLVTGAIFVAAALFASPARERDRRITLEFEGNPTTGYSWTYTMSPEGVVREVSAEYRQGETAAGRAGAGGTFVFVFEGLAPGQTELNFRYARPWESAEPLKTAVYVLKVEGAGNFIRASGAQALQGP